MDDKTIIGNLETIKKYLLLLVLLQFIALTELIHQNSQLRIELQNLKEEMVPLPSSMSFPEM